MTGEQETDSMAAARIDESDNFSAGQAEQDLDASAG
jgi:hypothetical protein